MGVGRLPAGQVDHVGRVEPRVVRRVADIGTQPLDLTDRQGERRVPVQIGGTAQQRAGPDAEDQFAVGVLDPLQCAQGTEQGVEAGAGVAGDLLQLPQGERLVRAGECFEDQYGALGGLDEPPSRFFCVRRGWGRSVFNQ